MTISGPKVSQLQPLCVPGIFYLQLVLGRTPLVKPNGIFLTDLRAKKEAFVQTRMQRLAGDVASWCTCGLFFQRKPKKILYLRPRMIWS